MIQETLLKLGIPTYAYTVFIALEQTAVQKIGDRMPEQIGWIYGLSIETDGVLPEDSTKSLIGSGDAANLFLNIKYGASEYIQNLRLSNLLFTQPNSQGHVNPQRFLPVNLPMHTDLSESSIKNPIKINGNTVALTLYYIDKTAYKNMLAQGVLLANGIQLKR